MYTVLPYYVAVNCFTSILSGMSLYARFCLFITAESLLLTVLARFPAWRELAHRRCVCPYVAGHRDDKEECCVIIGQCALVLNRPNKFSFGSGQSGVGLSG